MRFAALLLALLLPAATLAQYPTKAVHVVIPFPAGGPTDVLARVVAQKLSERWNTPVVADNKPGAGGTIGSDFVAKSPPDGYVLLMATSSTHSIGPALQKLPYDAEADFTPIVQTWSAPNVLLVSPRLGVSDVRGLVALAEAKPGQLNFASSGIGTIPQLSAELFKNLAGIDIVHLPYKGNGLAIACALGQRADARGQHRHPLLARAGASDDGGGRRAGLFESNTWFGLLGPAGLPHEVVAKVNADTAAILQDAGLRQRFAAAFAARIRSERDKWSRLIRSAGIKVE
jgi:tripartite-type tricarboxylate transporter receptor subunit TctC